MGTASVDVARNDWTAEFNNQLPSTKYPKADLVINSAHDGSERSVGGDN